MEGVKRPRGWEEGDEWRKKQEEEEEEEESCKRERERGKLTSKEED